MTRSREIGRSATNSALILLVALITATTILLGVWAIGTIDFSTAGVSTGEVTVSEGVTYLDRSGQPTAVGEVENGLDDSITNVTLTITFTEEGESTSTIEVGPIVSTIPAGATIPYEGKLEEERDAEDASIDVTYDRSPSFDSRLFVSEVDETHRSRDSVTLIGGVESSGSASFDRPTVIATFYNENGTVLGTRSDRISGSLLEADGEGEFSIRYSTIGHVPSYARDYATYSVVAIDTQE